MELSGRSGFGWQEYVLVLARRRTAVACTRRQMTSLNGRGRKSLIGALFETCWPDYSWMVGNPEVNRQFLERYSRSRVTVCWGGDKGCPEKPHPKRSRVRRANSSVEPRMEKLGRLRDQSGTPVPPRRRLGDRRNTRNFEYRDVGRASLLECKRRKRRSPKGMDLELRFRHRPWLQLVRHIRQPSSALRRS